MMEYVCYTEKEKMGTVSSESLLQVLLKAWILYTLQKSGFSIKGLRVFILCGEQKIIVSETETADVRIWHCDKKKTLVLANQDGNIWIHNNRKMEAFFPAKDEEVLSVIKKKMGIKEDSHKTEAKEET